MRIQLTRADQHFLSPEMYDQIFSMHGITMIFWYASPILSGFSVYLVPLMIGARDMAFPRLNSFTYWTYLFSGILLYMAPLLGQAPHAGWFSYVPYTNSVYSPGRGMDFYALALIFLTISTTGGASNMILTILRHRAPGMAMSPMPLFLYSTLTISFCGTFRTSGSDRGLCISGTGQALGNAFFRCCGGRGADVVAAIVLVLRASLGLHHLSSGDRHHLNDHTCVFATPGSSGIPICGGVNCVPVWWDSGSGYITCSRWACRIWP